MQRENFNILFKNVANFFNVLSNTDRLRILSILNQKEMDVNEIHSLLNITQPRVSQHLKLLKLHYFVTERREGKHVFYSIKDKDFAKIVEEVLKLDVIESTADNDKKLLLNELIKIRQKN